MKLFSQNLELKALRTLAAGGSFEPGEEIKTSSKRQEIGSLLFSRLDESFFHTEPCRAAYKRLLIVADKRAKILSYDELCEDPALDEDFREVLRENAKSRCKSRQEAKDLAEHLNLYRKKRIFFESAKTTLEMLKGSSVDVEELARYNMEMTVKGNTDRDSSTKILTIGKDANAKDLALRALDEKQGKLLKSGFTEYDTRNGGLPDEGVMILASTTSGGKSTLRLNLCKNLYMLNMVDVITISLEMSDVKETRRLLSCLSGLDFWKFTKKVLKKSEREEALAQFKSFHKFGRKNNCKYSIFCPTQSIGARQLFMMLRPYRFKVVAIDYVSLLEGVDENDQWKALSKVVRLAKIFSTETNCLVIILAQLDSDDSRIRYAKGMLEHADVCWIWNYSKQEQRDLHELPIEQRKARDQELFPFVLQEEFFRMRVVNMPGKSSADEEKEEKEHTSDLDKNDDANLGSKKSKKKGKREDSEDDQVKFDVS